MSSALQGKPLQTHFPLFLNVTLHAFILFLALTVLYIKVIAPMESRTLLKEVNGKMNKIVLNVVKNMPKEEQAAFVFTLREATPLLKKAAGLYVASDTTRASQNKSVFGTAWAIISLLAVVFVLTASILAITGYDIKKPVLHIFIENVLIFLIIGGIEASFFLFIAKKFVPIAPSQLGQNALFSATKAFPARDPAGRNATNGTGTGNSGS